MAHKLEIKFPRRDALPDPSCVSMGTTSRLIPGLRVVATICSMYCLRLLSRLDLSPRPLGPEGEPPGHCPGIRDHPARASER